LLLQNLRQTFYRLLIAKKILFILLAQRVELLADYKIEADFRGYLRACLPAGRDLRTVIRWRLSAYGSASIRFYKKEDK